jgi:hypothetical protein
LLLGPGCGGATAQSGNQPSLALVSVHFGGADQEFVSELNTHLTEKLLRGGQDRPRPWEARFLDQSASQAPAFGPPPAPPFRRGPSTDGERDAGPGASSGPATPFPTGRQEDGPTGAEEAVFPAPLGPPGLPPDRPGAARERAEAGERPVAPPAGVDLLPLEDRSLTILAVFLARSRAAGSPGGGSPRGEEPPLSPFVVGLTPAPREGPAPQPNPDPTGAESAGQADWRVELDPPTEGGTPVPGWPRLLACLTGRRLAAPLLQGACLFGLWQARRWLRRKRPPMPPEGPVGPARRNSPDSLGPECR